MWNQTDDDARDSQKKPLTVPSTLEVLLDRLDRQCGQGGLA
jgi:hypothetical protein